MQNIYDTLNERGFIKQVTSENIRNVLEKPITCYIGFDPTASSLHIGSLLPIMALAHFQRAEHRPIAIVGGATAMIGDPSGKDKTRTMLSGGQIEENLKGIKNQLSRVIDFREDKALILNNADWLGNIKYIDFLRDIGICFSVNKMMTAECFKIRFDKEEGLTFLEFNYMLLQAYDFLYLNKKYNCILQMGGDDQWSNILAGIDLIRRKNQCETLGLTFPLIITATGVKMGKTEKGTVWLEETKTSVNDFYQYWRNVDDRDVKRFLYYFTFLDKKKIEEICNAEGESLNKTKSILAYQVTKLIHGGEKSFNALLYEKNNFNINDNDWNYILKFCDIENQSINIISGEANTFEISKADIEKGIKLSSFMADKKIVSSSSEAKRLIQQNGIQINNKPISDFNFKISESCFIDGKMELNKGKKSKYKILIS